MFASINSSNFNHFVEIKLNPGTSESDGDQLNIIGGKALMKILSIIQMKCCIENQFIEILHQFLFLKEWLSKLEAMQTHITIFQIFY